MTLQSVGLDDEHDVFITNTFELCDATPSKSLARSQRNRLRIEIERCQPTAILALGRWAAYALTDVPAIRAVVGDWQLTVKAVTPKDQIPVMPAYHPGAILRGGQLAVWGWRAHVVKWKAEVYGGSPAADRYPYDLAVALLATIPQLSRSDVDALLRHFGSLTGVLCANHTQLSAVSGPAAASAVADTFIQPR